MSHFSSPPQTFRDVYHEVMMQFLAIFHGMRSMRQFTLTIDDVQKMYDAFMKWLTDKIKKAIVEA